MIRSVKMKLVAAKQKAMYAKYFHSFDTNQKYKGVSVFIKDLQKKLIRPARFCFSLGMISTENIKPTKQQPVVPIPPRNNMK